MKAFISYSTAADQIIALRLQTLAAVYGFTAYVPPASTRRTADGSVTMDMNQAVKTGKPFIPLVGPAAPAEFSTSFPHYLVDPMDPSKVERQIVEYLASLRRPDDTPGLLALATLAVGLLLLGTAGKKP